MSQAAVRSTPPVGSKAPSDRLIENTAPALEQCRWCDALNVPHSRACPLGERYQQVQQLGGVPYRVAA